MTKKHYNLIEQIIDPNNLKSALAKTSKGKKTTFGYLQFKEYDLANLLEIHDELKDSSYRLGEYRTFTVYEPKPRLISALDFKDRLVQHALCNVISPIFDKALLPQTVACRTGLGTHAGVKFVQSRLRSTEAKYFLKTDYSKFFYSIDRSVLHTLIERKIGCVATLRLLRAIIPETGYGLPIGSLTSQLFANTYAGEADRLLHFSLKQRHWVRYMDDIVALGNDANELHDVKNQLEEFSLNRLGLKLSKWQVSPISQGINFLGYRIWPTHKLLRKDSVTRAKQKIEKFNRHNDADAINKFVAAWSGHAKWADTQHLFNYLEQKYNITF